MNLNERKILNKKVDTKEIKKKKKQSYNVYNSNYLTVS